MPSLSFATCRAAARIALASGIGLAGLAILTMPNAAAPAAEPLAFTIPAEEGYGIVDCMQAGSECGKVMATSWCEAHGHAHAAAFGTSEDVTGSTPGPVSRPVAGPAVVIRCDD